MKLIRSRSGKHEIQSTEDGVTTTTTDSYSDSDTFSHLDRKISKATRWMTAAIGVLGLGLTLALWQRERDLDDFRHELCVANVENNLGDRALWFALLDEFDPNSDVVRTITAVIERENPVVDVDDACG